MLARILSHFFRFVRCDGHDQIMDFMMTGAAALPVLFFCCGFEDEAAVTMGLAIFGLLVLGPWVHARQQLERAREDARDKPRRKSE